MSYWFGRTPLPGRGDVEDQASVTVNDMRNEGNSVSLFIPSPLIQENITSAVGWMTGDDDFLAEVYLSTPTARIQTNFGDTHRHSGVVRLKALEKAIATAKDHLKQLPLKQRLLFKLAYSGRGNRQLSTDLHQTLEWDDIQSGLQQEYCGRLCLAGLSRPQDRGAFQVGRVRSYIALMNAYTGRGMCKTCAACLQIRNDQSCDADRSGQR
jgi:hypothetical protein